MYNSICDKSAFSKILDNVGCTDMRLSSDKLLDDVFFGIGREGSFEQKTRTYFFRQPLVAVLEIMRQWSGN